MTARIVPKVLEEGWADGWPLTSPVGIFLEQVRESNTTVTAARTAGLDPNQVGHWSVTGASLLAKAGSSGRAPPTPVR